MLPQNVLQTVLETVVLPHLNARKRNALDYGNDYQRLFPRSSFPARCAGFYHVPTHHVTEAESKAGGPALIPKNAFAWPTLCGFLHLRPIPLHSRDERWGRSPLLFSNFHFSIFQV